MKVSIIVTTYKDLESLKLVLHALTFQDYKNFEVIVAEDDDNKETADYLSNYQELEIKHIFHPNIGRTKTTIQNKAIRVSSGEYLIFIDGDILPFRKFISSQLAIAKRRQILAGRRVNLDKETSQKIKQNRLKAETIEKYYLIYMMKFIFNREVRFEQGVFIDPHSFIYKHFLSKRKRNVSILGCNWSCFKDDFIAINGFDEGYENSSIGEDTDLDWRFNMAGYKVVSSKNIANAFHLYHKKTDILGGNDGKNQLNKRKSERQFFCNQGISQHND